MTIMAGVYSRSNEKPCPRICSELKNLLSRHKRDKAVELGNDRVWIAKVDIGAFGSAGVYTDAEGGFSVLTGEPILGDDAADRLSDLKKLHADWVKGDWSSTIRTRGAFSAACYSPGQKQLRLITDRLGLRGLYYMMYDEFLLFASAFRIIEELTSVKKTLDIAAVAESCTFGMPLGDRTNFLEAKRLLAAEAVVIDPNYTRRFLYWSWDSIRPATDVGIVERLYESFIKAITLRLRGDRSAFAFLSGGLDSRCIVAGLARQGAAVYTLNISGSGTQDRALGLQFAQALGTRHLECDAMQGPWWKSVASGVTALQAVTAPESSLPERPGLIWNGDGGSFGFGHIHLTQEIVDLARTGDRAALAKEFMSYNYWSLGWRQILRRGWSEDLCAQVEQRFRSEMCRAAPADPGRVPYFFLLFNDQRRKLDSLQQNADLIRAEMLTPFFDIEFLSNVAAAKIDRFIGHKLYVEWLRLFQPTVHAIPWQAYPGHVGSSVPVPVGLAYQWDHTSRVTPVDRTYPLTMLGKIIQSSMMPGWLIRREVALIASVLTLLGISNYRYLIESVDVFATAWATARPAEPG